MCVSSKSRKKAGVKGYFLKNISIDELIDKIKNSERRSVFDESLRVISQEEDVHIKSTITVNDKPADILSDREKEILIMVCKNFRAARLPENFSSALERWIRIGKIF